MSIIDTIKQYPKYISLFKSLTTINRRDLKCTGIFTNSWRVDSLDLSFTCKNRLIYGTYNGIDLPTRVVKMIYYVLDKRFNID